MDLVPEREADCRYRLETKLRKALSSAPTPWSDILARQLRLARMPKATTANLAPVERGQQEESRPTPLKPFRLSFPPVTIRKRKEIVRPPKKPSITEVADGIDNLLR